MTAPTALLHLTGSAHPFVDAAIGVAVGVVVVGLYYLFLRFYVGGPGTGAR